MLFGCEDSSRVSTRAGTLVSEGVDPIVGLENYNVEIAQRIPVLLGGQGYTETSQGFRAMMAARTTALQFNRNTNPPGCDPAPEFASAFAAGYSTIVASHHATAGNAEEVRYRFMLPAPDQPREYDSDLGSTPDHAVYDRLYRLGLTYYWETPWADLERTIMTWEVDPQAMIDWNMIHGVDAMAWKSRPKCLPLLPDGADRVHVMGPGLFVDWLRPMVSDLEAIGAGVPVFAAHVNTFQFRGLALPDEVWDAFGILFYEVYPFDTWHLASFPGYRGEEVDCVEIHNVCSMQTFGYSGCESTSLDAGRGSSGGAVHVSSPIHLGGAIGLIHGGYDQLGDSSFWGLLDDVAQSGFNAAEMPDGGTYTIFTPFTEVMIEDMPSNDGPIPQVENGSPWQPNPDLFDTAHYTSCLGPECAGSCVGDCSAATVHELKCSPLFSGEASGGAGIGLTGGVRDGMLYVGDLGVVCGPLSAWSWTNFWDRVGYVTSNIDDLLHDAQCTAGPCGIRPFSRALVTDWLDKFGEVESRPFQLCPPGFMLRGAELNFNDVLRGVTALHCVNPSGDGSVIPLDADAPEIHGFPISTWIGTPDSALQNHTIQCVSPAPILTGLEVYRGADDSVVGLRVLCSQSPPPLLTSDECSLPIPDGVVPHGDPQVVEVP